MNNLLVVGSVAFDAIETPYGKTDKILGGAGTYISLAASHFNKNINLISVVGGDFAQENFDLLHKFNINTEGIVVKKDEKTFFWSGKYHENMNKRDTLVTELNVLADFDPIVPVNYQNSDVLMLGNLSPVVQRKVIERLTKRPLLIVMDTMNFWMNTMHEELMRTIKMVDILVINDDEAKQLSFENSLIKAARLILANGLKFLIIKKGEHGALLFSNEKIFWAPALLLEQVFDPTGAGDSFAGGFCGYISRFPELSFDNLRNAVIAGSASASFTVEKFGVERLTEISLNDIKQRINQFVDLTKFGFPDNF